MPLMRALGDGPFVWIEFLLATPVVLWGAEPFFERGWRSLVNRHLNMFTLISLGVGIAYAYSIVAAIFPGLLPPTAADSSGMVAGLFRGRRGHHRAGAARPGARTARAQPHRRRDPRAARAGAEDRAALA